MLGWIARMRLLGVPGERYEYGGTSAEHLDFTLLGAVVDRLSPGGWEQFVSSEIFAPIGVETAAPMRWDRAAIGLASPYQRLRGVLVLYPAANYSLMKGWGDIHMAAREIFAILDAVIRQRRLGDAPREAVLESLWSRLEFGIVDEGRMIRELDEVAPERRYEVADTNGYAMGYSYVLDVFLERGWLQIVMSNVFRDSTIYDLRRRLARLHLGLDVGLPGRARSEFWRTFAGDRRHAAELYRSRLVDGRGSDLPLGIELVNHVREFLRTGRLDDALDVAEFQAEIEPEGAYSKLMLGRVFEAGGEPCRAREAFAQALVMDELEERDRAHGENALAVLECGPVGR